MGFDDRHDTFELHLVAWRDELQDFSRDVVETVKRLKQQKAVAVDHDQIRDIVLSFDSLGVESKEKSGYVVEEEGDEEGAEDATRLLAANAAMEEMEDISHLVDEVHRALCLDGDNNLELQYLNGHSDEAATLRLLTNDGALLQVGE